MEFILFSGVIKNSHSSVGLSRVHIVQWGGLEFTLFIEVVWSSRYCVKDRVEVWSEDKW